MSPSNTVYGLWIHMPIVILLPSHLSPLQIDYKLKIVQAIFECICISQTPKIAETWAKIGTQQLFAEYTNLP